MPTTPAIQVCQPGFDVRKCPDWAYLFNSDWPSLAIVREITVPRPSSFPHTIFHNLNFVPLVVAWTNIGGVSYGRVPAAFFDVTATTLTFLSFTAPGSTMTIRFYNVDISKEASYPLPQSSQEKLPYNENFGIKMAKDGRLIYSRNLNDFIIHSRAQSPAVLQVATEKGQYFTNNSSSNYPGPYIVYPFKTAYIPWALAARRILSSPLTYQYVTINGLQIIDNKMVFSMNGASGGSLIVLRDPLFYPNTVRVVY